MKPETLRLLAAVFELPRRGIDGVQRPAVEANKAAALCMRYVADCIDRGETFLAKESLR